MTRLRRASLALIALCIATAAPAEQVVLTPSKDNTIYSESNGLSNGAGEGIFAGRTGMNSNGAIRRALIGFDVAAAIPAGSRITGVELTLHVAMTMAGPQAFGLHRLLADWGEGGSNATGGEGAGAAAAMGDATWRFRFFSDPTKRWTADGGDFTPVASAIATVDDDTASWESTQALVDDVQGWLDAPASNFGWLIRDSEEAFMTTKKFSSRQAPTAANRPKLLIAFEPPAVATATPTPTLAPPATDPPTATVPAIATVTGTPSQSPTPTATPSSPSVTATARSTAAATATATAAAPPSQTATGTAPSVSPTATDTPFPGPGTAAPSLTVTPPASETATAGGTATASPSRDACVGDCDGSGMVAINELIVGVNVALGRTPLAECPAFDASGEASVTVNELIAAVRNALDGCPGLG